MRDFTKEALSVLKPIPSALEPEFILGMGEVMAIGADKYERGNWMKCPEDKLHLYEDALLRHIYSYLAGEKLDPETGLSHLYHAGCNLSFLDHFERKENEQK